MNKRKSIYPDLSEKQKKKNRSVTIGRPKKKEKQKDKSSCSLFLHYNKDKKSFKQKLKSQKKLTLLSTALCQIILKKMLKPFESLFDVYTVYVQHPVISKWLGLALFLSLFLNSYLLNITKQQQQHQHQQQPQPEPVTAAPIKTLLKKSVKPKRKSSHHHSDIVRPVDEILSLLGTPEALSDEEIISVVQAGKLAAYALEKVLGDFERAVIIRRALISRASTTKTLEHSLLPVTNYHYDKVMGACCENVIGYMPIPVGVAGKKKKKKI